MTKRLQVYEGDGLVVTFDPNICIHSAVCLRGLPAVFDVSQKRWVRVENASADEVIATVMRCPSGALQSVRAGAGRPQAPAGAPVTPEGSEPPGEPATPPRMQVGVRPNGPILIRSPVRVIRESGEEVDRESCSLCRCGATGNAPFCDGSHNRIGFRSPS